MRLKNAHITEIRAQTSREYKKEVNKQFRKYHSDLVKKIRVLKSSDPKTYWKIINGTNSEKHDASKRISSEMFLKHLKSLFNDTTRDVRDDREDQDADHYDNNNEDLNKAFEEWEILKALRNLKSNKACHHGQITTEFLKASTGKMTEIYTKLFYLILFSGKTPNEWPIGMIKPIYKQKGSCDDPNNYRGIAILSCFGKLFTSVINN